jgi:hypothetical protein
MIGITYAFSSNEEGSGALLGGPMPAMMDAEVAEVSRVVDVRIEDFHVQLLDH